MNRQPFGVDEWYHCYTRGVDKRRTFQTIADYRRFVEILYLANSDTPIHRSDLYLLSHEQILQKKRGKPLVSIGAYSLLPNHFHLIMQEITEQGIARFMQKVGTAYSMYFNIKNNRIGNVFVRPFRSRHVDSDEYLRSVVQYVHLNAAELFEKGWKSGRIRDIGKLKRELQDYTYSSFVDYASPHAIRAARAVLSNEAVELLSDELPPLTKIIEEAHEYYKEIGLSD